MKPELEQIVLPSISLPPSNNSLSYNIYLIDIHKMVKYGDVKCVKKNMYDQELNYLCVSYRHGREETQEWEVNTPDYVAYINTFRKDDLKTLCECIRKEPDLKHIAYIWIDAISIDQKNKRKMYETIQQKELIFEYASYILAVPDLHWYYLRSKNQLQDYTITHVWKYAKHIYQEINHGKKKKKKKLNTDIHWEDLNYQLMITWIYLYLHPQEHATFQFTSLLHQLSLIDQDLIPILQWDDDFASFYKLFKNALAIMTMKDDDNDNDQTYYFKEKKWYQQFYYENYYHPLKPASSSSSSSLLLSMDYQQQLQQPQWTMYYNSIGQQMHLDFNNIDLLKKQLFIWKKKWEQCQKDLKEAIQFLHNITDEWLNRTWVISEYHLARKKKTPIKLVYLSLLWNLRYEQEDHYHSFFTLFNGDGSDGQSKSTFLTQIERKLSLKRDYLDIILNSNASNPLDRFISILPLWDKYKHVLLYNSDSNNNNSSNDLHPTLTIIPFLDWQNITTMEALRLKLYEILDLDDKLRLLHACSYNIKIHPSFSTGYQEQWLFTEKLHQDQFQQIKGLYFIPELEITIIDDNEKDQDQHNNKISSNNLGSNKYEIEEDKDHNKWKINEHTSHSSPSTLTTTTTMIAKEKNNTSSSPSSSSLSATPLPFSKNITTIELGSDNDQLKIECDLYYEINYYHHPTGKRYPHDKFNAEFVIIPLYQKTDQQKNNRCFIPLWKKKTESLWEVYRMDSLYYSTGHYYFFKMSVGVLKNGIKEDGCFIIK
ncbi:unnamed protein product [Cunninghamella echinulata]